MPEQNQLQDRRKVPFAMVESAFLKDPTFTPQTKALYSLLITYGPERIFPGHQTLADHLGVSRQSVIRWLSDLKERGVIDWYNRTGTSNLYIILGYENVKDVSSMIQGCNTDDTPPCITSDTRSISNELNPSTTSPPGEKEIDVYVEMGQTLDVICPHCSHVMDVNELRNRFKSRPEGECLECGESLGVRYETETLIYPRPRIKSKTNRSGPWASALAAFCRRSRNTKFKGLLPKTRAQWTRRIKEDADGATVEETIAAIRAIEYWPDWLDTPFNGVFGDNLRKEIARMRGTTEPQVVSWGNDDGPGEVVAW